MKKIERIIGHLSFLYLTAQHFLDIPHSWHVSEQMDGRHTIVTDWAAQRRDNPGGTPEVVFSLTKKVATITDRDLKIIYDREEGLITLKNISGKHQRQFEEIVLMSRSEPAIGAPTQIFYEDGEIETLEFPSLDDLFAEAKES